ncbi:unnamed protein product [Phytomonas sp. Hart1]|nr:unnamed protein product [Phytomonas sp. Hart1]|eukprot:CCW66919.1 unnamed protein product [Phytomonas sp. isolate Hart1]
MPPTCEDRTPSKGLDRAEPEQDATTPLAQDCWTLRLMERHITAYPSCINYEAMPQHAQSPSIVGAVGKGSKPTGPSSQNDLAFPPRILRTTNQITDDIRKLAFEMRQESIKIKMCQTKPETDGSHDPASSLTPINSKMGLRVPSYDGRSTYRHDYFGEIDGIGFQKNSSRKWLENYHKKWTPEEASDVNQSIQIPYLTIPERICKLKPTMYRSDYMPYVSRNSFRTLPHQVNLPGIGNTYAYSAYTNNDPRRDVPFDPDVASINELRSVLYETYTPYSGLSEKGPEKRSLREYLGNLRESMRQAHQGHAVLQDVRLGSHSKPAPKLIRTVVIPGTNGCPSQCIPMDPENYIMLPRDHFGQRPVYDY